MVKRGASELSEADQALLAPYPRDFKKIPVETQYGEGEDYRLNKQSEEGHMEFIQKELIDNLKTAAEIKQRPIFMTALIAGDVVIIDALHKAGLLSKVKIIAIDTYTLFPETMAFLREIEAHYGFKASVYHAKGIDSQADFDAKYRSQFFKEDGTFVNIEQYDELCKVEPYRRANAEQNSDCTINGRRRDHGAERSSLSVWEGTKLNPLAYWSFEDCWNYLRRNNVPYHPLHDAGYSSLGDKHSTIPVDHSKWFKYGGERSGRFQGLKNADGSVKTECGIHSKNRPAKKAKVAAADSTGSTEVKA
jgi:phosphoadenosine phosphosulfate reductase